jgi:hypothetical protein
MLSCRSTFALYFRLRERSVIPRMVEFSERLRVSSVGPSVCLREVASFLLNAPAVLALETFHPSSSRQFRENPRKVDGSVRDAGTTKAD